MHTLKVSALHLSSPRSCHGLKNTTTKASNKTKTHAQNKTSTQIQIIKSWVKKLRPMIFKMPKFQRDFVTDTSICN